MFRLKAIKFEDIPEGHLLYHHSHVWMKCPYKGEMGCIRPIKGGKETLWIDIEAGTLVAPMVNTIAGTSNVTNKL